MKPITEFRNDHFFLSNFYVSPIRVFFPVNPLMENELFLCPTVEHAFQAAKSIDRGQIERILLAQTPGECKAKGRSVLLRQNWNRIRLDIMQRLIRTKFSTYPTLRQALIDTGEAELIEGNWWGDQFWGESPLGTGANHLGHILMLERSYWNAQ